MAGLLEYGDDEDDPITASLPYREDSHETTSREIGGIREFTQEDQEVEQYVQEDCPGQPSENECSAGDNGEDDLAQSCEAVNNHVPQGEGGDAECDALPDSQADHRRGHEKAPSIAGLLEYGNYEERVEQHAVIAQINGVAPAPKTPEPLPRGGQGLKHVHDDNPGQDQRHTGHRDRYRGSRHGSGAIVIVDEHAGEADKQDDEYETQGKGSCPAVLAASTQEGDEAPRNAGEDEQQVKPEGEEHR